MSSSEVKTIKAISEARASFLIDNLDVSENIINPVIIVVTCISILIGSSIGNMKSIFQKNYGKALLQKIQILVISSGISMGE